MRIPLPDDLKFMAEWPVDIIHMILRSYAPQKQLLEKVMTLEKKLYEANMHSEASKSLTELSERMLQLTNCLGGKTRGQAGEQLIAQYISQTMPGNLLYDTRKIPHKGDYHLIINNKNIMLEVKNKVTIGKLDIDKFLSDVTSYDAGIFISLESARIDGHTSNIRLDISNGKPLVYVTNLDYLQSAVQIVLESFKSIGDIDSKVLIDSIRKTVIFMDEQLNSINYAIDANSKSMKHLQTIRNNIVNWRTANNKHVCPVKFSNNTIMALKSVVFNKNFDINSDFKTDETTIPADSLAELVEETISTIIKERVETLKIEIPQNVSRTFLVQNKIVTDRELRIMTQKFKMKNPAKFMESFLL